MSGGWFFVVASEAIAVGNLQIALPGVGSYVALAIQDRNLKAVGWAIVAMTVTILAYDQLMFRPMIAWADKFRAEQTVSPVMARSWVLDLFLHSVVMQRAGRPLGRGLRFVLRSRLRPPQPVKPVK
jgi:NitT/TauT family transport system permease protein